ncbi:hypothetical protein CBOM_03581 [Ceraceosorus bombacis]|uniref:Uncharacterized protein n=1 Tax=Ceraceosorus bombacis TaxID=401625 RepID=A0A0P1BHI7_9BASI|nr:hypothetical protein CBOM_03581 [Ceraceosorus bombacis]
MHTPPASAPAAVELVVGSPVASSSVQAKERDQRIQSARKKLKSYRAKQAAVEKKRVSLLTESVAPSESSSSLSRLSVTERPNSMLGKRLSSGSSSALASSSSPRASAQPTVPPPTSHTRSTSRAGHVRGHSRNGSISIGAVSPSPASLLFSTALPPSPAPSNATVAPQSAPARSANTTFVASTPHTHTRGHSRSGSRARSGYRPASLLFAGSTLGTQQTQPLAVGEWRDVDQKPRQPEASISADTPLTHARRPSRHSRQTSVSTRRESMEIMGGLGLGTFGVADSALNSVGASPRRHSRQMSSNRHSGILSASLLFGGGASADSAQRAGRTSGIHKNDFDWRKLGATQEAAPQDDSSDRLTALEKLEGRSRSTSPATSREQGTGDNAYNDRQSRPSSVQLPSFDDVHGTDAMDKRKSISLLEANEASTSSEEPSASAARSSLTSHLAPSTLTDGTPGARPSAASSPVRERGSLDIGSEEAEKKRRDRAEEQETVKRNRRASLNPNPFKLKSRPASLYVGTLKSSVNNGGIVASNSLPHLAAISGEEEEEEQDISVDERPWSSTPRASSTQAPQDWSVDSAQRKLATARADVTQRQQAAVATTEVKRSWRSSMPSTAALNMHATSSPAVPAPAPAPRQGMRTLRLGSISNEHKGQSDSLSSIASNNTTASSVSMSVASGAVPIGRRQSLVLAAAQDLGQGLPSVLRESNGPSPGAGRRSSIHYKSSTPTPASAPAAVGNASDSLPSPPASERPNPPATAAPTGASSFKQVQFDELKATQQREHGLLEASRRQVERLTHELAVEKERSAREYAELESWSAEEKRTLGARIEHLEQAAAASANSALTRETELLGRIESVETELKTHAERLEDAEAERDMLQEDIDGWRTRCGDLEKSVRTERMAADEERRANATAKLRIQMLTQKLQEAGIELPKAQADETFEDGLPADLASVLRSPALGSVSPVVQQNGYFSPHPGAEPSAPPPQAIKLLKEMRQQIFNLAGTLEHERTEHVSAKTELDALREENARLRGEPTLNTTVNSGETESAGHSSAGSPPRRFSATQKSTTASKTKRHVFAYDSSMGSTSMGSGSVAAGTASTVPSEYEHGDNEDHFKDDHGNEDLLHGLGSLQTLTEIEEEEQQSDAARTPLARPQSVGEAPDLEAGGTYDAEESSSLPDLEHSTPIRKTLDKTVPVLTVDGQPLTPTASHSSCSSTESSHGPASPRNSYEEQVDEAIDEDYDESDADDEEEEAMKRARSAKPEFIREWSFEMAMSSIAAKRQQRASSRGKTPKSAPAVVETTTKSRASRPRRRRQQSSDDFFGLLALDSTDPLPALPTPDAALEMPPFYVEQSSRDSYAGSKRRSVESYDHSPRVSMRVSSGGMPAQQRPPVAKSAYAHAHAAETIDAAAAAGGMLSRMSLGGLTSAFSGLGGYLLSGQSGAVQAAAAATKACAGSGSVTPGADPSAHHLYGEESGLDSPQSSFSWTATRRVEDGGEPHHNDGLSSDPWAQHHLAQMRQQQERAW